jgi:hypothetical protein
VQPGTRLAIFVLTSRLRMIQSVTTDSAVLLAALNNKSLGGTPQQSPMLLTREELETDARETAGLMESDWLKPVRTRSGTGAVPWSNI